MYLYQFAQFEKQFHKEIKLQMYFEGDLVDTNPC